MLHQSLPALHYRYRAILHVLTISFRQISSRALLRQLIKTSSHLMCVYDGDGDDVPAPSSRQGLNYLEHEAASVYQPNRVTSFSKVLYIMSLSGGTRGTRLTRATLLTLTRFGIMAEGFVPAAVLHVADAASCVAPFLGLRERAWFIKLDRPTRRLPTCKGIYV